MTEYYRVINSCVLCRMSTFLRKITIPYTSFLSKIPNKFTARGEITAINLCQPGS